MVSLKFAVLKFTKHLNRARLPPQQAEAISEAFAKATGTELVTKHHLKVQLKAAKHDLIQWMAGLLLAQAGLVAAAIMFL
jgi:hypothetical protein